MQTQKLNIFYLLELLTDYSDTEHVLTANEIIRILSQRYGVKVERRALYGYIDALIFLGYDISTFENNGKGYYIRKRELDETEINMLVHSLYLNPECGKGDVRRISDKLQKYLSVYKRGSGSGMISADNKRSVSPEFIERTMRAVGDKRRISFDKTGYELKDGNLKEIINRLEVIPRGVLASGGWFYILYTDDSSERIQSVRSDMVKNIALEDEYLNAPDENICDTVNGKSENIIIRCSECILNELMFDFGNNVRILTHSKGRFTSAVKAPPDRFIPWAMLRLAECEIIEPEHIREKIKESIRNSGYFNELI